MRNTRLIEKDFFKTDKLIEELQTDLSNLKQQLVDYFTSIGTTQDSIADVDRATSNIASLESSINEVNLLIKSQQEQFQKNLFSTADLNVLASECNTIISQRLGKINGDLDIENENVEKIKFEFSFDNSKYEHRLFSNFMSNLNLITKPIVLG